MDNDRLKPEELQETISPTTGQKNSGVSTVILLTLMAILPAVLIVLLLGIAYLILDRVALEPYNLLLPNAGVINYAVMAVWMLIAVGLIPMLCLLMPAVSAFLFNLVKPLITSWLRAAFSGAVFLLIYSIALITLVVLIGLSTFAMNYSINLGRMIGIGLFLGVGLSVSLVLFGRLGAFIRAKNELCKFFYSNLIKLQVTEVWTCAALEK